MNLQSAKMIPSTVVPMVTVLLGSWFLLGSAAAQSQAAAFLQPDPITQQAPIESVVIRRGQNVLNVDSPIQCGDALEFRPAKGVKQVRVTTYQGGRNLILNEQKTSLSIDCDEPWLTGTVAKIWALISGGERNVAEVAASRGTSAGSDRKFALPVFAADSSMITAGRRTLFIPWVGGKAPYRVVLSNAAGQVLADETVQAAEHSLQLPELDLKPGKYKLAIHNSSGASEFPILQEDNLIAVQPSELPPMPSMLRNAAISENDKAHLYAYFLEGLNDGRWTFEAVQIAAQINPRSKAIANWLRTYSTD